jgi:hypothetical protein
MKEKFTWLSLWIAVFAMLYVLMGVPEAQAKAKPDGHQAEASLEWQIITPQVALLSVDGQPAQEAIISYSWFGNGFPTPKDFVVALITKERVYVIYKDYYQVFIIKGMK